jgi:hypothetical membrane protein
MNLGRLLLFIGSLQFIIVMLAAEQLYPDYSPLHNYISDLGALKAPTFLLFNSSVVLLGLLGMTSAFLLRHELGRLGALVLAVAAAGAVGVGIFPEDYGLPHGVSVLITFLQGAVAVIIMGIRRGGVYKPLGLAMGAVSLAALALSLPRVQTPLGIGGAERLIAYPILIFFILHAISGKKTS